MSEPTGTVRRYSFSEFGDELVEMEDGAWVESKDYDALRAQARELADILGAILAADERGQGLPFKEAMDRAQAVLKEGI